MGDTEIRTDPRKSILAQMVRSLHRGKATLCAKAIETCFAKAEQSSRTKRERMPQNDSTVPHRDKGYEIERERRSSKVMIHEQ